MTDGTPESDRAPTGKVDALVSGVRFGQFASVGIVGATADMLVLVVLSEAFGVVPEIATIVGIETAILLMFAINERWTFANEGETGLRPTFYRLARSHGVRAAGSATQFAVFVVLFRYFYTDVELAGLDLWLVIAKGAGMAIGVVLNYTFESLLTWQVHKAE